MNYKMLAETILDTFTEDQLYSDVTIKEIGEDEYFGDVGLSFVEEDDVLDAGHPVLELYKVED